MTQFVQNPFYQFRAAASANAERPYNGRGILLKRCDCCQLSLDYCICSSVRPIQSRIDFALIFHRDEVFKPTNTGRLVGEVFPNQSYFFQWDRTEPPAALISLINDPERECFLLFPADEHASQLVVERLPEKPSEKIITLVVLDGTWRQARRMFNRSPWLKNLKRLTLQPEKLAEYATREAAHSHYLSTAESIALALSNSDLHAEHDALQQLFTQFNQRYHRMKRNQPLPINQ